MSSSGQRRSMRIFELEAKKAQEAGNKTEADMSLGSEGQSSQRQRRKKPKVNHASSIEATNPVGAVAGTPLPQASALALLLDMLKRRDTRKFFAEPVNAAELIGYNNVVKNPMDFATISAKLSEGEYSMLEEFEHDIFLVFSNAMLFNPSNSVFYRQARAIREVAEKLFTALRADANNFEMEFALARLASDSKWTKAEARLINSIGSNKSKNLAAAIGEGSAGAREFEGMLQQPVTYNFYPMENEAPLSTVFNAPDSATNLTLINQRSLNYGQNASQEMGSFFNFTGGWGAAAPMVTQAPPRFNDYNYGAFCHWRAHPHLQLGVPNPQQVPSSAYPGIGLLPSLYPNPSGSHGNVFNQNANARMGGPDFGNPPAPNGGNGSFFGGLSLGRFSG